MGKKRSPEEIPLKKSELVAEAFIIFMVSYLKCMGKDCWSQRIKITMKSYNRYIKFQGFHESFDICLYRSGDIDIKMKELSHSDYVERIYNYSDNRAEQNAFLDRLRSGLACAIMEEATGKLVDYHSFMDLLHGEWHFEDAYNYFKNEAIEE